MLSSCYGWPHFNTYNNYIKWLHFTSEKTTWNQQRLNELPKVTLLESVSAMTGSKVHLNLKAHVLTTKVILYLCYADWCQLGNLCLRWRVLVLVEVSYYPILCTTLFIHILSTFMVYLCKLYKGIFKEFWLSSLENKLKTCDPKQPVITEINHYNSSQWFEMIF